RQKWDRPQATARRATRERESEKSSMAVSTSELNHVDSAGGLRFVAGILAIDNASGFFSKEDGSMVLAQRVFVASVVLIVPLVSTAQESSRKRMPISPAGERLLERLDAMEVTKYWLPHVKLGDNWQTGETNGKTSTGTHCSAFVAAFCYRESI